MRRGSLPVIVAAALVVAVAAFFAGRALHQPSTQPSTVTDLSGPAFQPSRAVAGLSKGGFSGFSESPAPDGRTIIAGRVVEAGASGVTLESVDGVRSTLRLTTQDLLRRIEPTTAQALQPGAQVLVRIDAAGNAAAVLLLP
jgi:hypothetical protein